MNWTKQVVNLKLRILHFYYIQIFSIVLVNSQGEKLENCERCARLDGQHLFCI